LATHKPKSPTRYTVWFELTQMRTIQVKVQVNARRSALEELRDGTWLASVKARPVDGKANEELIALVARHFRLCKNQVSIKSGATGRRKLVRIDD